MNLKRIVLIVAGLAVALTTLTACPSDATKNSTKAEQKVQGDSYNAQVAQQPAHRMKYSPTRDTVNFWIDTWSKPNKLSYVYLQSASGELLGYYVLKGLPVSYCAALTPTYKIRDDSDGGNLLLPAPGVDGVYYSGGQCNSYYGKDATTGSYIEFTLGLGINELLYDQPLPNHPNVQPLGPTRITK